MFRFAVCLVSATTLVSALPATSLLQVTVQLQRGSVGEMAPATYDGAPAGSADQNSALGATQKAARVQAAKPAASQACVDCPKASEAELDLLDEIEERDEDEMAALATQVKVSLLQTSVEHQHGPARLQDLARMHESGIDDDDEALGLLDALDGFAA
eukprot:gb/GFBE01037852.1/.p1 GENE.gb/GFBE01037852.1/~~gb/GFBE01037852.1/.p1  ORF type:complete len:157 (+),score=39.43 gb/GFBE01037852.1/:1-471(+)